MVNDENATSVELRSDGVILTTLLVSPYDFTWDNATGGSHGLTATVFDAAGESAPSAPLTVTVLSPFENYRRVYFTPAQQLAPAISGPTVDFDSDGYGNFMEHFLAMNPILADRPSITAATMTVGNEKFGTYSFSHAIAATDVAAIAEASLNLTAWEAGGDRLQQIGSINHGDGTRTVTVRSLLPNEEKEFFRLRLTWP